MWHLDGVLDTCRSQTDAGATDPAQAHPAFRGPALPMWKGMSLVWLSKYTVPLVSRKHPLRSVISQALCELV
jgi:hypothetical protein